jgi:hypothetical protein
VILTPGKFYLARNGERWCCFSVAEHAPEHARAHCVNVRSKEVEYFYVDGRYDGGGLREHCLVSETGAR